MNVQIKSIRNRASEWFMSNVDMYLSIHFCCEQQPLTIRGIVKFISVVIGTPSYPSIEEY